jgi:hypothetical protein
VQIPATSVMLDDGEIERRVRLIRPMEHTVPVKMMGETHWTEAERNDFASAWNAEVADVPASPTARSTSSPACCCRSGSGCRTSRPASIGFRPTRASASSAAGLAGLGGQRRHDRRSHARACRRFHGADGWAHDPRPRRGLQLRRVRVMGAYRIELSGFTDTMRERLAPMACSRDHLLEAAMFVPTDTPGLRCWSAAGPLSGPRIGEREAA